MSVSKFVKSAKSGRVFICTDELANRADMVDCTAEGQLLTGHVAEAETVANGVRKSKYIGLIVDGEPGRLFNYTPELALKAGAVSIDNPAEWAGDAGNVVIDKPDAVVSSSPALARTNVTDKSNQNLIDQLMSEDEEDVVPAEKPAVVNTSDDTTELKIPDVSEIEDKKEAQSVLCKWAFDNFNVHLNRTWGAARMSDECLNLLTSPDIKES